MVKFSDNFFKIIIILFSLSLLVYSSFINLFPDNFIFASGDFYQITNFENFFNSFSYSWEDARLGYYNNIFSYKSYYLIINVISSIFAFNPEEIAALNQFLFQLFSFLSFFLSIRIFHKNISFITNITFSICYAFNGFTLYFFVYTWGYTPFILIYCFVPPFFCFLNYFLINFRTKNFNYIYLPFLVLLFHLIGISFGNISWFFILLIISFVFFITKLIIDKDSKFIFFKLINLFIFLCLFTIINFWIIVPNLTNLFDQFFLVQSGDYSFSIEGWLRSQSTFPLNLFFNTADIYHLESLNFLKYSPLFSTMFLFFIVTFNKYYFQKIIIENFILLFFFIILASKGFLPILNIMKEFFFLDSFFIFFRSIDKSITFIPYFFFLIAAHSISLLGQKKIINIFNLFVLILTILSCYPFISGGLKTKYDLNFNSLMNFDNSPVTMIKEIPSDYFDIYSIINSDSDDFAVLSAPYNVLNSIGWQNYVKWKHIGDDPTVQYLNKNYISLNYDRLLGMPNLGYKFNQYCKSGKYKYVKNIISYFPVKYIIYHKDIHKNYIIDTYDCFTRLNSDGYLELIKNTENLILFKLNPTYRKIIQLEKELLLVPSFDKNDFYKLSENSNLKFIDIDNIDFKKLFISNLENDLLYEDFIDGWKKSNKPMHFPDNDKLIYEKINPTKFHISLDANNNEYFISFSNEFNKFWTLSCDNCKDKIQMEHIKINNYANGFIIKFGENDTNKSLNLILEFQIEKLKNYLFIFSIIFSIIILFFSFYKWKKNR